MQKEDFYKILCTSTPEEINNFISAKGKVKMSNAVTFITPETENDSSKSNEQCITQKI